VVVESLTLQNFRCFSERSFSFNGRLVIIEGPNGSGKSCLLEALHYCCYLRSFRTRLNRDLVRLGDNHFFVKIKVHQEAAALTDDIQVGFSDAEGKVVRWNQTKVTSYKDLVAHFKVITLVADDINVIQGEPEMRRDFLNYALMLNNPSWLVKFKTYRQVLEQRNSILARGSGVDDTFMTWTQKLWEEAAVLRQQREEYLRQLENVVNRLLEVYFSDDKESDFRVELAYATKHGADAESFDYFWRIFERSHAATEWLWRRSLFGIHLDDVTIIFQKKKARVYASRGQQKLLAFLLKIAQLEQLSQQNSEPGILLLDDFMTDFDRGRVERCLRALQNFNVQIFLSTPIDARSFLNGFDDVTCHINL
jgi:DNA replication and repair protein RecF